MQPAGGWNNFKVLFTYPSREILCEPRACSVQPRKLVPAQSPPRLHGGLGVLIPGHHAPPQQRASALLGKWQVS